MNASDVGGFKEIVANVSGSGVFARLKFESGVHRVQRVPVTESGGRIHTSAATVAVLPEPTEVDVLLEFVRIFARPGHRRSERTEYRERPSLSAPRCVERQLRALVQAPDAVPVLAPLGQPPLPALCDLARMSVRARPGAFGLALVDPGAELGGRERGEAEQQVPKVALRVDRDRRNSVDGGLLEQTHAQTRLPAPGHAETDGVRREVAGGV
jgi:hypothetical protein